MHKEQEDTQVIWPLDAKNIYTTPGWLRGQEGAFSVIFSIPERQTTALRTLVKPTNKKKATLWHLTLQKETNLF